MKEVARNYESISHALVFIAMILLVLAMGIGSGLGILLSFIAVLLTTVAVVISMINEQRDNIDP